MRQVSMNLGDNIVAKNNPIILKNCIVDRWSKYSFFMVKIKSKDDINKIIRDLKKEKYYKKATHNTYAYRILSQTNSVEEWKNDDGETWAGMCVLREMKRKNIVNALVIVTRYFGWVYLQADRFKNVINTCKLGFEEM